MRILVIVFLLLVSLTCFATLPEYFSSRKWIEQHASKNQVPQDERLYVGDSIAVTNTCILRFHAGILLRDVIDATHYKSSDVDVIVLRGGHKGEPLFREGVRHNEKPKFELQAGDAIWIAPIGTPVI